MREQIRADCARQHASASLRQPRATCHEACAALYVDPELVDGGEHRAAARPGALSARCPAAEARRSGARSSMAQDGEWLAHLAQPRQADATLRCEQEARRCDAAARHRLSLRAPEACPARLSGAEGDRARRPAPAPSSPRAPLPSASISSACAPTSIEAAEQCNLVFVPEVMEPEKLDRCSGDWRTVAPPDLLR